MNRGYDFCRKKTCNQHHRACVCHELTRKKECAILLGIPINEKKPSSNWSQTIVLKKNKKKKELEQ